MQVGHDVRVHSGHHFAVGVRDVKVALRRCEDGPSFAALLSDGSEEASTPTATSATSTIASCGHPCEPGLSVRDMVAETEAARFDLFSCGEAPRRRGAQVRAQVDLTSNAVVSDPVMLAGITTAQCNMMADSWLEAPMAPLQSIVKDSVPSPRLWLDDPPPDVPGRRHEGRACRALDGGLGAHGGNVHGVSAPRDAPLVVSCSGVAGGMLQDMRSCTHTHSKLDLRRLRLEVTQLAERAMELFAQTRLSNMRNVADSVMLQVECLADSPGVHIGDG